LGKKTGKKIATATKGEPMKTVYRFVGMMLAAVALLALSAPVYASKMDNHIESAAKKTYLFKTFLQFDKIKIKSVDGVVSLRGSVSEASHKSLAQETVASLPGVQSVDNRLEVTGEIPAENSDPWITARVKTIFLLHRDVSAMTEVNTKDGIVALQGKATTQEQKDLTTEYAKDISGVKDVNNEMTVKESLKKKRTAGKKIDDASITAQVKLLLLYHRSTAANNISVTTKEGVVTLNGKAGTASVKDLATKFANDVNGVKGVENQMTVE
jgi:hyperosmotically inducible periplasmic protein